MLVIAKTDGFKRRGMRHLGIMLAYVDGAVQPFVTWTYEVGTDLRMYGHYFGPDQAQEALADFNARAAEEARQSLREFELVHGQKSAIERLGTEGK